MPVLGQLAGQLKQHFALLKHPVELAAALDDGPKSRQLADFLDEVAALSELITVTRSEGGERRPSFAIRRVGTDVSVRFAAIPLGHELTSFVLAVLQVGGHPPAVKPEVLEQVRQLDGDYEFTTYLSLTCQNCPEVVQALNLMSVLNPRIRHVAVDGSLFKAEVEARNVLAVPTVYLGGEEFDQGRMTIEHGLRLSVYLGERDRADGGLLADVLIDLFARHRVRTSALLRGIEGFGIKHRLRSERLLTLSEDLPLVALALDTTPRIEAVLEEVRALARHGLITLERARLLSGHAEEMVPY